MKSAPMKTSVPAHARVGEQLSGRPPHHPWVGEHRTKVRPHRGRSRRDSAGEDRQRNEGERQRRRYPGEPPARLADDTRKRHPDDPSGGRAEQGDGKHARTVGRARPVGDSGDGRGVGEPDTDPDPELCERDHGKAGSHSADGRRGGDEHEAGAEQLAQAHACREQAGGECSQPGGQARHRA